MPAALFGKLLWMFRLIFMANQFKLEKVPILAVAVPELIEDSAAFFGFDEVETGAVRDSFSRTFEAGFVRLSKVAAVVVGDCAAISDWAKTGALGRSSSWVF